MRLLLKVVMMTVVLFGGMNYMAYLHTGKSLFPMWLEKTLAGIGNAKQSASEALDSVKDAGTAPASREVFYKWTDADGVLQYTNAPPPEGIQAQIVKVDPNANLIQAVPVPGSEPEPQAVAATEPEGKAETPAGPDIPFPYSPEQVKKTMEDARKVQQMMNEKMEKQQQILDNL